MMKLKPCPFCGGKAVVDKWKMSPFETLHISDHHGYWYAVSCDECMSEGAHCITEENAIKSWNMRV